MPRTFFDSSTAREQQPGTDSIGGPLLIVGASTRAAAHSAIRAGFAPICCDLFADLDLRACARVMELDNHPRGLAAAARLAPECPWMYTGGLENHPAIVRRISQSRPLWGNAAEALARIRNPWLVAEALAEAGLPALGVWPRQSEPPAPDGSWMHRPVRGAAGRGIGLWDSRRARTHRHSPGHYFQERREGTPLSALFLAFPEETVLLGITRQLVGLAEVHAPPFAWCGTITPANVPLTTQGELVRIGQTLARWAGLCGLFGCDVLVHDGTPWLTEVNPRYPASTELVEHLLQAPLLDWHRRACAAFANPPPAKPATAGLRSELPAEGAANVVGKIVLYADRELTAIDLGQFIVQPKPHRGDERRLADPLPYVADIPLPGTQIPAGQPVCTLFARARGENECLDKLARRAARLETRLRRM